MDYKVSRGCIKSLLETFQLISVPECGNMLGNGCLVLMVWGLNSGPCACKASSLSPSSFPSPCYSADKNMDEVPLVKIRGRAGGDLASLCCLLAVSSGRSSCLQPQIPYLFNEMCSPQLFLAGFFFFFNSKSYKMFRLIMG